jgi:glycosyltransferase involved in cell wall biosynthesis
MGQANIVIRKTILVISDNRLEQINGAVRTYRNMERHALDDGYEIVYITPNDFPNCSSVIYPEVKLAIPCGLGKKIEELKPAYIHISTEGTLGHATSLILNKEKIPYTTCYHTKFAETLYKICWFPQSITHSYLRWFHNKATKVLAPTASMVKEMVKNGIIESQIVEWTHGADDPSLDTFILPRRTARVHSDKPRVLFVGRVCHEKSIDDLCKLWERYQITVVGDGPYLETLKATYPNVNYTGYKQGSELSAYYTAADVLCFPSSADTFGIVIIEAMIHGTPVAAYPVTGPVDIIENGVNGYMNTDLSTAIDACLDLDREVVRENGQKWTWRRCWEIFRDNLVPAVASK